nr:MAG TPA: hypothetical protein [Caudoviricetes sp.]
MITNLHQFQAFDIIDYTESIGVGQVCYHTL